MNTYPPIALLVLNYNGLELLKKYLPSVIVATHNYPGKARVIVVDNNSSDDSLRFIGSNFPEVEKVIKKENAFLFAYNDVVADLTEDIFILLNNDVQVDEKFILPLVEIHRNKDDVFGVMPLVDSPDPNEIYRYRCSGIWGHGQLQTGKWLTRPEPGPTLFAHGGACLIDRKKFMILGGFDPIFWPGYYEDEDISYRAWRRGWSTYYEPASKVVHHAGSSFGQKFKMHQRDVLKKRNGKIFIIKNIHDRKMILQFIFWDTIRLFSSLFKFKLEGLVSFYQTIALLPNLRKKRKEAKQGSIISDKEVFDRLC